VAWEGTSRLSTGDVLKEPPDPDQKSALSEAKEFLLTELAEGSVAAELVRKVARAAGIKERTLKRAKRDLGVRSKKESDGIWSWVPPDEGAEGGQAPTPGTLGTVGPLGKDANPRQAQSAYLREGGQGGHEPECGHGFPAGAGCYLCDPRHPYRLGQGTPP
jgi:hypothetical protein